MRALAWSLAVLATVTAPVDPFLDASMSRHMLLQMPLLLCLGYLSGRRWSWLEPAASALVVFAAGSVVFWMLPRSLDMAVDSAWVDQAMHLNLLLAGGSFAASLPAMAFHVRMALGVYGLAMLSAAGAVYAATAVPVCSTYTLAQQNEAGVMLIGTGVALFCLLLVRGGHLLAAAGRPARERA